MFSLTQPQGFLLTSHNASKLMRWLGKKHRFRPFNTIRAYNAFIGEDSDKRLPPDTFQITWKSNEVELN